MIALLDVKNDVIATGADKYTVESFNLAYPNYEYPAVTKVEDVPSNLKYKVTSDNINGNPVAMSFHSMSGEEFYEVEDLRCFKRYRRDQANVLTKDIIVHGMLFPVSGAPGGYARIPMTDEDQRNYLGMVVAKDMLSYSGEDRVKVKCLDLVTGDTVYFYPENADAVVMFFGAGLQHIKTSLEDGWVIKDDLMGMTLQELKDWVDPRL